MRTGKHSRASASRLTFSRSSARRTSSSSVISSRAIRSTLCYDTCSLLFLVFCTLQDTSGAGALPALAKVLDFVVEELAHEPVLRLLEKLSAHKDAHVDDASQ